MYEHIFFLSYQYRDKSTINNLEVKTLFLLLRYKITTTIKTVPRYIDLLCIKQKNFEIS